MRPVSDQPDKLPSPAKRTVLPRCAVSPEQLLRTYFRAKDENRPHLLHDVFSRDARLTIDNRCAQISFPGMTVGLDGIADVLVRQFSSTYENTYSFYLDRP